MDKFEYLVGIVMCISYPILTPTYIKLDSFDEMFEFSFRLHNYLCSITPGINISELEKIKDYDYICDYWPNDFIDMAFSHAYYLRHDCYIGYKGNLFSVEGKGQYLYR